MHRHIVIAFFSLMLAGCYTSGSQLLDPSSARQPVPPDSDGTTLTSKDGHQSHLSLRSDGQYDVVEDHDDGAETHVVLVNDFGSSRGHPLYVFSTWDEETMGFVYGIVVLDSNGGGMVDVMPDCAATEAARSAASAGAKEGCSFSDRAQLFNALGAWVNTDEFWAKVAEAGSAPQK